MNTNQREAVKAFWIEYSPFVMGVAWVIAGSVAFVLVVKYLF